MMVASYYKRDSAVDDVTIDVVADTYDFLAAAGHITAQQSAGTLAADAGSTLYVNADVPHGTKADARLAIDLQHGGRSLRIEATSILSAAVLVIGEGGKGEIIGTATVSDTTDPGAAVVLDNAATVIATVVDNGEPGDSDTIAITIWSSKGVLLLSSRRGGGRTVGQTLNGGNFVVHNH